MSVRIPLVSDTPLVHATFVSRPAQLVIEAQLDNRLVLAHLPDRSQLEGLLYPGARLLLAPRKTLARKMAFQVVAVYVGDDLVSLDTQLPNRLVEAALEHHALPQFARYTSVQPEALIGPHRFDFRLGQGLESCIIEVNSVGEVVNDLAMFPDAPTERGRRQVEALTELAGKGQRTVILFIVQRSTGKALVPNEPIDPLFARALRRALAAGVEVYAYRCPVTPEGISLGQHLPVYGSLHAASIASGT